MKPRSGSRRIAAVGKPEQLVTSSLPLSYVEIEALPTNTSIVYLGDSYVRAVVGGEAGMPLAVDGQRGDRFVFDGRENGQTIDISFFWVDVRTANDGVTWFGMQA